MASGPWDVMKTYRTRVCKMTGQRRKHDEHLKSGRCPGVVQPYFTLVLLLCCHALLAILFLSVKPGAPTDSSKKEKKKKYITQWRSVRKKVLSASLRRIFGAN